MLKEWLNDQWLMILGKLILIMYGIESLFMDHGMLNRYDSHLEMQVRYGTMTFAGCS